MNPVKGKFCHAWSLAEITELFITDFSHSSLGIKPNVGRSSLRLQKSGCNKQCTAASLGWSVTTPQLTHCGKGCGHSLVAAPCSQILSLLQYKILVTNVLGWYAFLDMNIYEVGWARICCSVFSAQWPPLTPLLSCYPKNMLCIVS